jgi:hypothetical protein
MSDKHDGPSGAGKLVADSLFAKLSHRNSWADKRDGLRTALDFVASTDEGVRLLYGAEYALLQFHDERPTVLDLEWILAYWRNMSPKQRSDCSAIWCESERMFRALDKAYADARKDGRRTLIEDARAFRETYEADEAQAAADYETDRGIKEFKENETLVKEIPNPTNDGSVNA